MNNIGSLFLGLIGWLIPCLVLWNKWKWKREPAHVLSLSACAMALCFQIFEAENRIYIGDFSALLDTWDVVADLAVFLWGTTVLLNLLVMWKKNLK